MAYKHILICMGLVLLLVGRSSVVAAQNADLDLFKEIEKEATSAQSVDEGFELLDELASEMDEEQLPDKSGLFNRLYENLGGSVRVRYIHYLQGVQNRQNADLQNDHLDYILKVNTYANVETCRFDVAGWVEGGNQSDTYAGVFHWLQDADRDTRRHLEINELYLTLYRENFDFAFGKNIFKNGISTLYSPADRLRPRDMQDPLDPKDLGIWNAKIDYYWKDVTFTGAFFPVYQGIKIPPPGSRWRDSRKDEDRDFRFRDQTDLDEDYPDVSSGNFGYFLRTKTTLEGWDLFISAYHGPDTYAVLYEKQLNIGGMIVNIPIVKTVKVSNLATGFSTTYQKWEFHGEALYQYSHDGKDDNYINFVGGFNYIIDDLARKVFMERIDITLEYAHDETVRDQHAQNFIKSSTQTRIGRNDIFARIKFKLNEDLTLVYASHFESVDTGQYNHFGYEYKIKSGWIWQVALETFDGEDDGYYSRWQRNDRIYSFLEYKF